MFNIIILTMSLAHPVQYTTVPMHEGHPEYGLITRLPDGRSVETKPIHDGRPEEGTIRSERGRDCVSRSTHDGRPELGTTVHCGRHQW